MNDVHLVVFDMAGTTVRDDGQVPRAFAAALARHGVALSDWARPERIAVPPHASTIRGRL